MSKRWRDRFGQLITNGDILVQAVRVENQADLVLRMVVRESPSGKTLQVISMDEQGRLKHVLLRKPESTMVLSPSQVGVTGWARIFLVRADRFRMENPLGG